MPSGFNQRDVSLESKSSTHFTYRILKMITCLVYTFTISRYIIDLMLFKYMMGYLKAMQVHVFKKTNKVKPTLYMVISFPIRHILLKCAYSKIFKPFNLTIFKKTVKFHPTLATQDMQSLPSNEGIFYQQYFQKYRKMYIYWQPLYLTN